jgi:hypothetical protein
MHYSNTLSFAIKELLSMDVDKRRQIMQDLVICSGTMAETPEQIQTVLETYQKSYWKSNPTLAANLMYDLMDSGRLIQPRLKDQSSPVIAGNNTVIWNSFEEFRDCLANNLQESHMLGWTNALMVFPTKEEVMNCSDPSELCVLYQTNVWAV